MSTGTGQRNLLLISNIMQSLAMKPDAQGILDALEVTLPTGRLEEGAYDSQGSLYKIPQAVISDPTDVIEDIADMDSQTVTGPADADTLAAKLEAAEGANTDVSQTANTWSGTTEHFQPG